MHACGWWTLSTSCILLADGIATRHGISQAQTEHDAAVERIGTEVAANYLKERQQWIAQAASGHICTRTRLAPRCSQRRSLRLRALIPLSSIANSALKQRRKADARSCTHISVRRTRLLASARGRS